MARRKTHDEFLEDVKKLAGDEYLVLDKYVNSRTPIKFKHVKCGSVFELIPNGFISRGRRCPYCNGYKKSHDQFVSEVEELVGNKYKVLGKYKTNSTYIEFLHVECNRVFKMIPSAFLRGQRCSHCFGNERKTTEEFKQEVYELVGEEYEVISHYKNSKTHVKMKHNICEGIWEVMPNSFLRGSRCPYCFGKIKKTQKEFEKEVFELVGRDYTVLGEYKNYNTKILMKHNECGYEYKVTPAKFLHAGRRCPKCNGGVKSTHEEFVVKAKKFNFEILGKYKNNHTPILVRCKSCSYETMMRPGNVLSGKGCKKCAYMKLRESLSLNTDIFKERVYELVGDEYEVIGEYKGSDKKIYMKHTTCGHKYYVTPSHFTHSQRRCPRCVESSGESLVRNYLEKLGITFESQYWFHDCRNVLPLPFDFALFYNDELIGLIEYQGQQHYEPVEFFGGLEGYKKTIKNDMIKRNYCKVKNIPLLTIKYDENVELKIDEFLNTMPTLSQAHRKRCEGATTR